jgi:hypothetical protein
VRDERAASATAGLRQLNGAGAALVKDRRPACEPDADALLQTARKNTGPGTSVTTFRAPLRGCSRRSKAKCSSRCSAA